MPSTLGKPYGIDAHGRFEGKTFTFLLNFFRSHSRKLVDGSISRADAYFGDDHSFNVTRWDKLVNFSKTENAGLFDAQAGHADRVAKYNEARATNRMSFI